MMNKCKGRWHDYPNCEMCPLLLDTCDGSDEYQGMALEESMREDEAVERAAEERLG